MTKRDHDVEGNYGQGWELVTSEERPKEARKRLQEYRDNEPQYSFRIVKRKAARPS